VSNVGARVWFKICKEINALSNISDTARLLLFVAFRLSVPEQLITVSENSVENGKWILAYLR